MQQVLDNAIDLDERSLAATEADMIARGIRTAPARPFVFSYTDLWQHDTPLLDMLRAEAGHEMLACLGGTYGWSVRYRQREDYVGLGVETLADYIDAFREGTKKLPYLRHISLNKAAIKLRRYIKDPVAFGPNWVTHPRLNRLGGPELFIGQQGTTFGHVHRDHVNVHVGFVQLQGEKEMVLFPPEDRPYMYACPGREFPFQHRATRVRYVDLENYADFPLLRQATPHRIVLREGQALVMPANWWHTTYNRSDSISYSIRIVNSTNVLGCAWQHLKGVPRWLQRAALGPPKPAAAAPAD